MSGSAEAPYAPIFLVSLRHGRLIQRSSQSAKYMLWMNRTPLSAAGRGVHVYYNLKALT